MFNDMDSTNSISLTRPEATILITGEEDAYNEYYTHKPPLAAAANMGEGRVIVVAGKHIFTSGSHPMSLFEKRDNQVFALRAIEWLARKNNGDTESPEDNTTSSNNIDVSQLEPGDILMINASSWLYYMVELFGGYWGHTGMYVGNGEVIEAVGEGVRQLPIEETHFWDARDWVVKRVNADDLLRAEAVAFAKDQVGKPYNTQFGNKWYTDDGFYCTQLVWKAYWETGIDIDSEWSLLRCLETKSETVCNDLLAAAVSPDDIYYDDDLTEVQAKKHSE